MGRIYEYIGPDGLRGSVSERHWIRQPQDVRVWIGQTGQQPEHGLFTATFIVDTHGRLWIADRRSEHVACAVGQPVLAAGEMAFEVEQERVRIAEVSNQSLGYCPEPESWPAVATALVGSGLAAPAFFTSAYTMRLCGTCGAKNIVKDGVFACGVCGSALPPEWNFGPYAQATL